MVFVVFDERMKMLEETICRKFECGNGSGGTREEMDALDLEPVQ